MDDEVLTIPIGAGRTARVCFADPAARAALEGHLELLCRPEAHAGAELERVKSSSSRTVWRLRIGGAGYYLKQYHSRSLAHRLGALVRGDDAWRELRISRRLRAAGVRTIEVLALGRLGPQSWMLSREIAPAVPLGDWHDRQGPWGPGDGPQARRVAGQLAEQLGRMHAAGLFHGDLHAGNILLAEPDGRAWPVITDLHRIRRRRRGARRWCGIDLAMLMHDRLGCTTRSRRLAFLRTYLQALGGRGTLRGWAGQVARLAERHWRRQVASRDRRLGRPGRYFAPLRLPDGWRGQVMLACKGGTAPTALAGKTLSLAQWQQALAQPRRLLEGEQATVVKDSPSVCIVRRPLTVGPQTLEVYVKWVRRHRGLRAVWDMVRPGRALRAFRLGHALITRRIPTALPLAVLEQRRRRQLRENILITEAVSGAEPLNRFLQRRLSAGQGPLDAGGTRLARQLLWQLGRLLRCLYAAGFAHRDLKASNLVVGGRAGEPPRIVLVDLDGLSRPWVLTRRRQFQGLMRLNVSLLDCPAVTRAGRLRMLLGYLRRPGAGRIQYKPYWRELERWSARKLSRQIRQRRRRQRRVRETASSPAGGAPTGPRPPGA